MAHQASVVIEKDEHGFYAWCPELKGCQSQGAGLEEALVNIKETSELYLETLGTQMPLCLSSRNFEVVPQLFIEYGPEQQEGISGPVHSLEEQTSV